MKIALAQLNFCVGDIENNARRMMAEIACINADIIVFPELALTGYPPEDLFFRSNFNDRCEKALQEIIHVTNDKIVIVGYPNQVNTFHYNKAAVIQHQKIIANYTKQKLPNYTVFDEERYFKPGNSPCIFSLHHSR